MSERIFKQGPTPEEIEQHKQTIDRISTGNGQGFYIVVESSPTDGGMMVSNGGAFISGMSPFDVVKVVLKALDTDIADLLTAVLAEQSEKK